MQMQIAIKRLYGVLPYGLCLPFCNARNGKSFELVRRNIHHKGEHQQMLAKSLCTHSVCFAQILVGIELDMICIGAEIKLS